MHVIDGYRVRPATRDDAEAITEMFVEQERMLHDVAESTVEDLYDDWSGPDVDIEKDTVTVWDGEVLVGYAGLARVTAPDIYSAYGGVKPTHWERGLGTFLVEAMERRALERQSEASIRQWVDAADAPAIALLEGRGYRFVRRFWRMDVSLEGELAPPEEIEGVVMRPFVRGHDERPAHDVIEKSFTEHWGYSPKTYDDVKETRWEAEWFRADLSLIAEADDGIVGVCINGQRFGEGYVEDLGVLPGWRGKGIAEALLRRSFQVFRDLGMKQASLNVDSDNATGAMRLYERVGMKTGYSYDVYERKLS